MNVPPAEIRNATLRDIPSLQDFLQSFVDAEQILPRDDDELATLIRHGFIAFEDARIVGFAALEIYSRKLAEIQALAVDPQLQRRGLGTILVQRCVERAKAENVLELMAITASESLFISVGFDYSLPNQKRALFMQTREGKRVE